MPDLTKSDLEKHSYSYRHNHGVMESDVKKANHLAVLIRNTRSSEHPVSGDIMICKGPAKTYKGGHIQSGNMEDYSSICTQPYVPFVCSSLYSIFRNENEPEEIHFSASGGYWFSIPKQDQNKVRYIGKRKKIFKAWGHCGPCGDGAFYFEAEVNVWEYFSEEIY